MSFDKEKFVFDQLDLLKKHGKQIALEELVLLVPEIASVLVGLLPAAIQPMIESLEAPFIPQVESALQKLIEAKLT